MSSWIKKAVLALVSPLLLFILCEAGLRAVGIGYPTDFLIEAEADGEPVWVDNPFFTYRYFAPPLARLPAPIEVHQTKPADVFRVVVLGESAAQGDPLPDFGPPRMLEYVLRQQAPGLRVEVINGAVTAINSHVIKTIAKELPKLQPDVVLLYIGNNEVIGPYGPGTVFAGYVHRDWAVRLISWLNRLRLTQVLRFWMDRARATDTEGPEAFRGVAMFMDRPVRPDDPRLPAVRRRYRANLERIIQHAQDAGARVLLSTVAVNVEECPPSVSVNTTHLPLARHAAWQAAYDSGQAAVRKGDWAGARAHFETALTHEDLHAESHYWLGICVRETDGRAEALPHFVRAMDLDAFRYRADTELNDLVHALAAAHGETVQLVDVEPVFRRHPRWTDADLFVDHVHFTFEGTALLAHAWADALLSGMEKAGAASSNAVKDEPDVGGLRDTLMYTAIAEISVWQEMYRRYQRPPFDRHPDVDARTALLRERIHGLNRALRESTDDTIVEAFRDRMDRYPDDAYFPSHCAQWLITFNRFAEARAVIEPEAVRHPHRRGPRATRAFLHALDGRPDDAADTLLDGAQKHGFFAMSGVTYLLSLLTPLGYYDEAAEVAEAVASRIRPLDYRSRVAAEAEKAAAIRDRMEEARHALLHGRLLPAEQALQAVLRVRPDLAEAGFLMAVVQGRKGAPGPASRMARESLAGMNVARAYYHGALWQAKAGNQQGAQELLDLCARHVQDEWVLANSLAWVLAYDRREWMRNVSQARTVLERMMDRRAVPAPVWDTYAAVLAASGEYEAARQAADTAHAAATRENRQDLLPEIDERRRAYETRASVGWGPVNRPLNHF